jgi:hypothetical protein
MSFRFRSTASLLLNPNILLASRYRVAVASSRCFHAAPRVSRLLSSSRQLGFRGHASITSESIPQPALRALYATHRAFSSSIKLADKGSAAEDINKPAQEEQSSEAKEEPKPDENESSTSSDSSKGDGKEQGDGKAKEEAKSKPPPPPPHGDKSPWQVFTETLNSEFKASKEWNESTKALGSAANQFSESESVKRARAMYEKSSGAATSHASSALKSTGRAIGHSAAWTWDTSIVKGVRKGANAVGRGVDKATKPIRDTEAFKSVKDVIDDGSSSRYGGWQEKEERRKARELREMKEVQMGKRRAEKMEEDPK